MRSDKVDKRKKYPPAYYRYRNSHVTLSILLSNDLRDFLDHYKEEGMAYPDMIKDAFEKGKRMSEVLEAEYKTKLESEMNDFIQRKNQEYEGKLQEEKDRLEEEFYSREELNREEIKRSISWDISQIRRNIINSFNFNQEGKSQVWKIFEAGGFSGNSMNFPDTTDNSTGETKEV